MDFTGERFIPIFEADQEIAIEHIQRYISIQELISGKVVLDAACGEGYGTNIIANNASMVYGIDICKEAIDAAKRKYKKSNIEFNVCSIQKINLPDNSIDIAVSFETIEHVSESIQKEFLVEIKRVLKPNGMFIISTPNKKNYSDLFNYENEYHIKEFYEDEFIDFLNDYFSYIKLYSQSFEVTSILSEKNPNHLTVIDNVADTESKYIIAVCSNQKIEYLKSINSIIINRKGEYLKTIKRIIELQSKIEELSKWGEKINDEKDIYIYRISELQLEVKEKDRFIDNVNLKHQNEVANISIKHKNEIDDISLRHQDEINTINNEKQNIYNMYKSVFEEATKYQNTLQDIYNSNMWRLASRYYRIRDKVNIFKWFHKNIQKNKITKIEITSNNIDDLNDKNEKVLEKIEFDKSVYQDYKKQDIIILSVIDWDFRFQRPQHIAENMARLGHRVFYFNANYVANDMGVSLEKENLYLVTLNDSYGNRIYDINFNNNSNLYKIQINEIMHRYHIRDCSVIVEYPTWYPVAKYLKKSFGCNIIFDYIDDYTGFEETTNAELIKTTEKLLNISNVTIATSLFLYEKAKLYTENVEIVRNGTEFKFFNNAKSITKNKTSKIGYYGAIAEWFDIEKIAYIAQNRPDVEIELIGNVSHKPCNELKKYKNIKFLGEKNYKELPNYLKNYDVCLIPFRADIDLIKATNPVKFYEYLSAGKKIVATEIPELEPFRNEYVYLANDNEEFLKYINLCLDNNDDLVSESELIDFAKKQDWNNRCKQIDTIIKNSTPLVSVILVTYNNIEYTKKCIKSIFQKTAYPNYEIIIVDNLSVDGTQDYLKELEKEYDNITIILNDDNLGFAAGNNVGIKACKGQYIILLNNDTVVTRGWITSMIKHLDKNNIGMVGPVTNSIGNESQINVTYKDINDMDEFALNYTTLHHDELYENIQVLAMFCVAIKRDVLEKVGLLDENYKIGMFEDDDYSIALRLKGYEVACVEDVFIHHFGNASFKKLEDKKYREIFEHNKSYFESKWKVLWTPHKYRDGVEL